MNPKQNFIRRLWITICPVIAAVILIVFADELVLIISPFPGVSFTTIVFILFLSFSIVWSFLYNTSHDLIFLLKWISTGFKKEEAIKEDIEIALERVRLQLNDINKITPEELELYAKNDFVLHEIERTKNKLNDKISALEIGVIKRKITSLPTSKNESSTNIK